MNEAWLLISAGQGPAECQWVVARLVEELHAEANANGLAARLAERDDGERSLPRSVLISLEGDGASAYAASVEGTVQWIGASPFRPRHRRKNWFAGIFMLPVPEDVQTLDERDVSFQTLKASGPGGQHVNTTDSAVRAVHAPTGITVLARDGRSQHANRRLALVKIAAALCRTATEQSAARDRDAWQMHREVERGNPVRVYTGDKFRRRD